MDFQVIFLSVALLALVAFVMPSVSFGMNTHMFCQIPILGKTSPAKLTHEGLFTCVSSQVVEEVPSLSELSAAAFKCADIDTSLPILFRIERKNSLVKFFRGHV